MLKLKRLWPPYLLQYVFLISAISLLSLTSFAIDVEDKPNRIATVLN